MHTALNRVIKSMSKTVMVIYKWKEISVRLQDLCLAKRLAKNSEKANKSMNWKKDVRMLRTI